MKISYNNKKIYLIDNNDNLWEFYAQLPIGYVHLSECSLSDDKDVRKNAVNVSMEVVNNIRQYIGSEGTAKEPNYDKICEILGKELNISNEELNEIFGYNEDAIELFKRIDNESLWDFTLYRDCLNYLEKWNGDKDRTEKFIKRFCRNCEHVLVDVFPSEEDINRPTWESESWLLHKFHRVWGDELYIIIKEAVAKYPDFKDIDYAGYYVDEKLKEKYERI